MVMTIEEILAISDEEIEREITEVMAMPPISDDGKNDCPPLTDEMITKRHFHRVRKKKKIG